ncbi:MAG: Na(+)/H(+) antiporter subunit D [Candidatus Eutrophobiaceae bacterium]
MIASFLHPGGMLILCGLLLPLLSRGWRIGVSLAAPLGMLAWVWLMPNGTAVAELAESGLHLHPVRVDALARVFLTVFCLAVFAGALFAARLASRLEIGTAFVYAGAAMGAVIAGDLLTLFVFWELMAIASTLLIWSSGSNSSYASGMRYALIHLLGGVLLMIGIAGHALERETLEFVYIGTRDWHSWFILAGFLINAGAPPLSAWIADAYPESSPGGMVFLSAFTTKTAVYVLLRGFPGTEILVDIGLFMVFYGIIYALLENDMRRILAYSIVNQVGFMICGIGIGTTMALNGVAAHAFTHIIYKALLLMSAGAVLHATGKRRCSDLGGLVHAMPFTCLCGCIGALAISSFPFTSGFVSKSMVTQASADEHMLYVWLLLQAASAGVFLHAGIKFPWFVFFQKDSGLRPPEAALEMKLAMGFFALLCIVPGIFPELLYQMLPWPVAYEPYTAAHVLAQLQLLLFSGLAFFLMLGWMKRTVTISLDLDWIWRRLLFSAAQGAQRRLSGLGQRLGTRLEGIARSIVSGMDRLPANQNIQQGMLLFLIFFALGLWYLR